MSTIKQQDLWRLTLDTNPDYCNLNCIMCEDHSPYSESRASRKKNGRLRPIMTKALLEKTIREAAALGVREIIPSTMGEPLLYPHFEHILFLCRELNLSLNVTTNGTFPSTEKHQNVEYWANHITPIGSDVKISWNGANAKTHEAIMLKSSLDQHVEYAKRFIAVRDRIFEESGHYCRMTMQLTYLECNIDEIPDMVRLAIELGFDRVKGHHLWSHFEETHTLSLRRNILAIERWNYTARVCQAIVEEYNKTDRVNKKPFKLDNFFELDTSNIDDISPSGECPFLGREAWVDPTGRFNVCCAPDQQRLSLGDYGNLNNDSLESIVTSASYRDLTRNYMAQPLCQSCNMRRPAEEKS